MNGTPRSGITVAYETTQSREIHWHEELWIVYLLGGRARVTLNGKQYLMHEADIVVINPFELYNIELLGTSDALSFQFAPALLERLQGVRFDCVTCAYSKKEQERFDGLRTELAEIFRLYFEECADEGLELLSHAYRLLNQLCVGWRCKEGGEVDVYQPRVSSILEYLNTHYAEELSLGDLAAHEYLSANYLSQFFRDKLDTTFTQYLNEIRLNHAFFELCSTAKSITDIALDNGFGRVDAFIERFRRKYETTPGKFRRGLTALDTASALFPSDRKLARDAQTGTRFQALTRFALQKIEAAPAKKLVKRKVSVRTNQYGKPVGHDWRTLINAGYAADLCSAGVQEQLRTLQRAVGFEYVRFHGIFSDAMHLYEEDADGLPALFFTHVDLLLDQLLSMGLKPFIEFSFLPRALASKQEHVYENHSYICFPNDLSKWKALVRGFLMHCINLYGLFAVRQWKFSLFSVTFAHYGFLTAEEYAVLYRETYWTVKQIDPKLQFGGPGLEASWLLDRAARPEEHFFETCKLFACVPDFVTMQSFPHSFQAMMDSFNRMVHFDDRTATFSLSSNEDFMADAITAMKELLAEHGLEKLRVLIEECGSTAWPRDLCSDTCYKAVHIVKNMTENMDRTIGKAYWTLSDLITDWKSAGELFHGGHGLFTCNGVPKAAFYALQMLSRMGGELLASGQGWYITRGGGKLQVLLYHYCHYNAMYRKLLELQDPNERYSAFQTKEPLEYELDFSDAAGSSFVCEYIRIGRGGGSALDEWIRLGAPSELSAENLTYLKHRSEPVRWIEQRSSLKNLRVTLEPLEVLQIIITAREQ